MTITTLKVCAHCGTIKPNTLYPRTDYCQRCSRYDERLIQRSLDPDSTKLIEFAEMCAESLTKNTPSNPFREKYHTLCNHVPQTTLYEILNDLVQAISTLLNECVEGDDE